MSILNTINGCVWQCLFQLKTRLWHGIGVQWCWILIYGIDFRNQKPEINNNRGLHSFWKKRSFSMKTRLHPRNEARRCRMTLYNLSFRYQQPKIDCNPWTYLFLYMLISHRKRGFNMKWRLGGTDFARITLILGIRVLKLTKSSWSHKFPRRVTIPPLPRLV